MPPSPVYQARLKEELELIEQFQFTKVFLQVRCILEILKELSIPHIIRGSAGSSLVCFLMGITEIDPVFHGLELARFMNRGRTDLPDIDIDVPYNRREEIYSRISALWPGAVARISNHVKYQGKMALRETAKDALRSEIHSVQGLRSVEDKKRLRSVQRRNFKLDKIFNHKETVEAIRSSAAAKIGTLRHYSKHCGGIVIFEEEGEVPPELCLKPDADAGIDAATPIRQLRLNKDETEEAGYIKIDILSNRGLSQLIESDPTGRPLLEYPERDSATEAILASGDTLGITFGESRGMRRIFVELRPRHMRDVAVALALIRPAASVEGRKAEFLERWKWGAEESEDDPLRRPILFDDDAILLIQKALGCDAAAADKWRKAFAKENPKARIEFRRLLIQQGIPRLTQDILMDNLDKLALYSFCKSHALSYAQLVWALAYQKAHRPHLFWLGALNHCHSDFRKWVHYREARCSGVQLSRHPPPYRLGQRDGQAALYPLKGGEQQLLFQRKDQPFRDVQELGYWLSEEFLPNCGMRRSAQQRLEAYWHSVGDRADQQDITFRGPIACGRVLRREGKTTLLTIGIRNGEYLDLVIPNQARDDILGYACVEGRGWLKRQGKIETVEVSQIRGVSWASLEKRPPL